MEDKRVALKEGSEIGGYVIDSCLACGGNGITYKAHRPAGGEIVILKEIFPYNMAENGTIFRNEDGRIIFAGGVANVQLIVQGLEKSLEREIHNTKKAKYNQVTKEVSGRTFNVDRLCKDVVLDNELALYIKMDTDEGCTMEEAIKEKNYSLKYYVELIRQLLVTLNKMGNICHLDIKPSNIYMHEGNIARLSLIDYGSSVDLEELSKSICDGENDTEIVRKIETIFTPSRSQGYVSPEMEGCVVSCEDGNWGNFVYYAGMIGKHTDFYSVGALFYYLICGEKYNEDYGYKDRVRVALKGYSDKCIDMIISFLDKALAYDIEERYGCLEGADIEEDLSDIAVLVGGEESNKIRYGRLTSDIPCEESIYSIEDIQEGQKQVKADMDKKRIIKPISGSSLEYTYVERTELLDELREYFADNSSKRCMFLTGQGGSGKSEIARGFGFKYSANNPECADGYELELLLPYPNKDEFLSYQELLRENGLEYMSEKSEFLTEKTLIIIDNFNRDMFNNKEGIKVKAFINELLENTGSAHIIVTSRLTNYQNVDMINIDDRGTVGFARQVFKSNYEINGKKLNPNDAGVVDDICELISFGDSDKGIIGCNILAAALIGKRLGAKTEVTVKEFYEKIKSGIKNATKQGKIQTHHNEVVYNRKSVYDVLFEVVFVELYKMQGREFEPEEKDMLTIMSLVPAQEKNLDMVCNIVRDIGENTLEDVREYAYALHEYNWIKLTRDDNGDAQISVHPLLAEFFNEYFSSVNDREEQYLRLAKNVFGLKVDEIRQERYLVWKLWKMTGTGVVDSELIEGDLARYQLVYHSIFSKRITKKLIGEYDRDCNDVLFFVAEGDRGNVFGYYLLDEDGGSKINKEKVLLYTNKKTRVNNVKILDIRIIKHDCEIRIPDYIMDKAVEEIPDNFVGHKHFHKLIFPRCLKKIGKSSFCHCWFDYLNLPNTVELIGAGAFAHCTIQFGDILIPELIQVIEPETFFGCSCRRVILPPKLKEIKTKAFATAKFYGCSELPDTLRKIERKAFYNCSSLREDLYFPNGLKHIGEYAFAGCSGLCKIVFGSELEKIEKAAFFECSSVVGDLIFGINMKEIGDIAFAGCKSLNGTLYILGRLEYLGDLAFLGCKELKGDISLIKKPFKIGKEVFAGCNNIIITEYFSNGFYDYFGGEYGNIYEKYTCDASEETLDKISSHINPFYEGYSDGTYYEDVIDGEMLIISDGVEEIPDRAYHHCKQNISNIVFPDSLKRIGAAAFIGCTELNGSLVLPDALETIGIGAFMNCSGLDGILKLPLGLIKIETEAFEACDGLKGGLSLPDGLEYIGRSAFSYCHSLNGDIRLPNSIIYLGSSAFLNCISFDGELYISNKLRKIETYTFANCVKLRGDIELPIGIESVGEGAFMGCVGFDGELHLSPELMSIGDFAFKDCVRLCGDLMLPQQLFFVGQEAFRNCVNLTGKLTVAPQLIKVGKKAFDNCKGLEELDFLSNNLMIIEESTFSNCSGLKGELTLPSSIRIIEKRAFYGCSGLTGRLVLPECIEHIGEMAFSRCSFSSIEFPDKDIEIEGDIIDEEVCFVVHPNTSAERYAIEYGYDYTYAD